MERSAFLIRFPGRGCHIGCMGRGRLVLLAGLVAVVVAGGISWLTLRTREPVYQGKSLTAWLEQVREPGYQTQPTKGDQAITEAETAITQIGTNALPYLMKMAAVKDSVLKDKLIGLSRRQSIVRIHFRRAADYHYAAAEGLSLIIPALTNRLSVDENETNRWQIVAELEDAGIHVQEMRRDIFGEHLPSARRVFLLDDVEDITELCRKALTDALSDKALEVRSAATNALKRIDADSVKERR